MTQTSLARRLAALVIAIGAVLLPVLGTAPAMAAVPTASARMASPAETPTDATAPLTSQDTDAWLDGIVPALLEREGIVGATVVIVDDGAVVTQRGYGWAGVDEHGTGVRPVDPQSTLFRIGSISKLFVATSVMQLVERGRLDLDAPITEYVDFEIPTRFDRPITLRHLLTHSAGFEEAYDNVILPAGSDVPELRDVVSTPPQQVFEPGTTPGYSNYSNTLAAYIVERMSGTPFADYATDELFGAAEMGTATYAQPLPDDLAPLVTAAYPATGQHAVPFELVGMWPAGSMSASGADMASFMLAQLETEASPLLSAESLATMHAPALTGDTLGGLETGATMAVSFYEATRHGVAGIAHGGDLTHSHADLWLAPAERSGIFVALNSSGSAADSSTAVRDQLIDGFVERYLARPAPAPAVPTGTSADHAAQLAGAYELSRRAETTFLRIYSALTPFEVTADGLGGITITGVTDASGVPLRLVEVEPWVWQVAGSTDRIAVRVGDDGSIEAIGLHPAFVLTPMSPWRAAITPLLVSAAALLAIALVAWPARALVGVRLRRPLQLPPVDARLRVLSLIAAALVLAALALWFLIATQMMGGQGLSQVVLRSAQVLTLFGMLGAIPAVWRMVRAIAARRWWQGALAAVVALGFVAWAYVVIAGGLLTPSIHV